MRVGLAYDVHRLVEGRKLIIGGVEIPYEKGLLGHSDADVLVHAIIDALLGVAGLDDIGTHYPDTDERFKGACSLELLKDTVGKLTGMQYTINNIDATIVAEAPKLRPYIDQMKIRIAAASGVAIRQINIKATTTEGLGFEGRGEGISAQAIALISKIE